MDVVFCDTGGGACLSGGGGGVALGEPGGGACLGGGGGGGGDRAFGGSGAGEEGVAGRNTGEPGTLAGPGRAGDAGDACLVALSSVISLDYGLLPHGTPTSICARLS